MQVMNPWLSDSDILYLHHRQLFRYNLTTKIAQPLPKLTHQITSSSSFLDLITPSPDGKQVSWGQASNGGLYAANIDGNRCQTWPDAAPTTQSQWCADGHHWIEFQGSIGTSGSVPSNTMTSAIVHDTAETAVSRTYALDPNGIGKLEVLRVVSPQNVIARTPDTFLSGKPNNAIKSEVQETGSTSFHITSFTVSLKDTTRDVQDISIWDLASTQSLHSYRITLPGSAQEVMPSPKGDRLAWLLIPAAAKHDVKGMSIWVSQVDGSEMRCIGVLSDYGHFTRKRRAVRSKLFTNNPLQSFAYGLEWLPSSHKLGFTCDNALWTVPVNE